MSSSADSYASEDLDFDEVEGSSTMLEYEGGGDTPSPSSTARPPRSSSAMNNMSPRTTRQQAQLLQDPSNKLNQVQPTGGGGGALIRRRRSSKQECFIEKLYKMATCDAHSNVFGFSEDGTYIEIRTPSGLAQVLNNYFKHTSVSTGKSIQCFTHPQFRRGATPEDLNKITRKTARVLKKCKREIIKDLQSGEATYRKRTKELEVINARLETEIARLERRNAMLVQEISVHHQQHPVTSITGTGDGSKKRILSTHRHDSHLDKRTVPMMSSQEGVLRMFDSCDRLEGTALTPCSSIASSFGALSSSSSIGSSASSFSSTNPRSCDPALSPTQSNGEAHLSLPSSSALMQGLSGDFGPALDVISHDSDESPLLPLQDPTGGIMRHPFQMDTSVSHPPMWMFGQEDNVLGEEAFTDTSNLVSMSRTPSRLSSRTGRMMLDEYMGLDDRHHPSDDMFVNHRRGPAVDSDGLVMERSESGAQTIPWTA